MGPKGPVLFKGIKMEDVIGWSLMLLIPVAFIFGFFQIRKMIERRIVRKYEAEMQRAEAYAKHIRERNARMTKMKAEDKAREVARTKPGYYSTSTTPSTRSTTDDGPDLLTTMVVLNSLTSSDDTPTKSSSWYSSSDSSSSSDSWSSSSSDSGSSSSWD
jgi:hypothetical protein